MVSGGGAGWPEGQGWSGDRRVGGVEVRAGAMEVIAQ